MKKNIVIVLLAICVLGLGGFLFYDKVLKEEKIAEKEKKDDKNKIEKIEKLDDSKDYYYYETTEVLGELLGARDESAFGSKEEFNEWYKENKDNKNENIIYDELFNRNFLANNGKIQYKYPVINLNSDDAKKINLKIKELIDNKINLFPSGFSDDFLCVGLKIAGKVTFTEGLNWDEFKINESDKYISIIIFEKIYNPCGDGATDVVDTYIIDKSTGNKLSKSDIIEKYNIDVDDLAKSYNDVMVKNMDNYSNDFISVIENGAYYFWIGDNNKLYVIIPNEFAPGVDTMILENNKWIYDYNEKLFS